MSTFNEQDHPRHNDGRFAGKPQQSAGIGLLTGGPQHHTIEDPELQGMTGPFPYIDGAIVEYENGRRARIEVSSRWGTERVEPVDPDTGDRLPYYIPQNPYRIVSVPASADPQRVQDELENVARGQRVLAAHDRVSDVKDRMARFFDDRDMEAWNETTVMSTTTSGTHVRVQYSNDSGGRYGTIEYSRDNGLRFGRVSDTGSQRARRLWKNLDNPAFRRLADEMLDRNDEAESLAHEFVEHRRYIEETYGRRM